MTGCVVLAVCLPALEVSAAPDRQAIIQYLAEFEVPISPQRLAQFGPGWEEMLCDIADDPKTRPFLRVRALAALGHVPTPRSEAILRAAVEGAGAEPGKQSVKTLQALQALKALVRLDLPGLDALLIRLLDHPALDVRTGAAQGLVSLDVPGAELLVGRRILVETDPAAKESLEKTLQTPLRTEKLGPVARAARPAPSNPETR